MRLTTEEHPMLLAEPSHNTAAAREKMVELMFEKYNVPAVFLAKNAVLSSFATARQTSLVVDVGHESTVGKFFSILLHRRSCTVVIVSKGMPRLSFFLVFSLVGFQISNFSMASLRVWIWSLS